MTTAAARQPLPTTSQPQAVQGQDVGYVRVSTADQNTARQLEGIALNRVFTDKASGKDRQRPQLVACMAHLRDGDRLHVHSMDRLARNLDDLRKTVDELTARGVTVVFHKEGMTFEPLRPGMDAGRADMARLMLSIMGAVAEFERSMLLERQREGIAIAKAEGKYKGAKAKLTEAQAAELRQRAEAGEAKAKLAAAYGISRGTVYAYMREANPDSPTVA